MPKSIKITLAFITFFYLLSANVYAAGKASIKGFVTDRVTGETLPGANIFLVDTYLGCTSDMDGYFVLTAIPSGSYTLRIQYLGYRQIDIPVDLKEEETLTLDIKLEPEAIEGETIVVTVQAKGQKAAINQQLAAQAIVNVVSSEQIQELPDANAAESIRRLPGVSIVRYGGEGSQVVIRGLAPKYNVITIDGVRMSSSNPNDRSTDLSMISSTMLEGIEISKSITADQDADVLGGTVNFKMREARGGKEGIGLRILAQGGYTGLYNAPDKYSNYKFVPGIEGRFFNDRLGVFFEANIERRNLTSNSFGAAYDNRSDDLTNYVTQSVNLHFVPRDRNRLNGALALDYKLANGKISLSNFFSSSRTKMEDRNEVMDIGGNSHVYSLNYSDTKLSLIHNTLRYEADLPLFHTQVKLSHSYSETDNPDDWRVQFYQVPANISQFLNEPNVDPRDVAKAVYTDAASTNLYTVSTYSSFAKERSLTAALDLDFPVVFSQKVDALVKFGGKYRRTSRAYTTEVFGTNATFISPSAQGASRMIIDYFNINTNDPTKIPLSFFVDNNYPYGDILDGEFVMHNPIDFDLAEELVRFCQANVDEFAQVSGQEAFARNNYLSTTNNYNGDESVIAGYVMATFNIGNNLKIIPGVRYQQINTSYFGVRGQQSPLSYQKYYHPDDTTTTEIHGYWLPSVNLKYKPLSWFDVRMSYSKTITYPDYNAIIPRIDVTTSADIAWNNFQLKPSTSENYDLYFTFSENTLGLLTAGGFVKKIKDLIYPWKFSKPGLEAKPYYLPSRNPSPRLTYNISTYINNPFTTDVYGLEFNWQTHFWYLPNPFKGLVLDLNYSRVFSEARYPYVIAGATSESDIDTSFTDRLVYQPNHIFNMTLGYDYKGFSIRVSWLYQDDVFTGVSQWPQLRSNTAAYSRWDISVKQKLPWYGFQLYGNLSNLNNARDESILQMYPDIPKSLEQYGMVAEIGLRWQL